MAEQAARADVDTLQLVDRVAYPVYAGLRHALPGVRIVQVVHVLDEASVDEATAAAEGADAILLDSGNPNLPVKELGGTSRKHDWAISRAIRERIDKPLFLAGGLTPENVAEAIRFVRPFGVDFCSGVRTEGQLDPDKVARFMQAVHGADES